MTVTSLSSVLAAGLTGTGMAAWWLWKRYVQTDLMHSCGHNCEHGLSGHELCAKVDVSKELVRAR